MLNLAEDILAMLDPTAVRNSIHRWRGRGYECGSWRSGRGRRGRRLLLPTRGGQEQDSDHQRGRQQPANKRSGQNHLILFLNGMAFLNFRHRRLVIRSSVLYPTILPVAVQMPCGLRKLPCHWYSIPTAHHRGRLAMKIVIAPQAYKGSISALNAARAMAEGALRGCAGRRDRSCARGGRRRRQRWRPWWKRWAATSAPRR